MGEFIKDHLPDPLDYYTHTAGLVLIGKGPWRTTRCEFHGGSDSMRVNIRTGAFVCMAGCGARGGDMLAYHRAAHGLGFVAACKDLGAWVDDGKPYTGSTRPSQPPARVLLQLAADDLYFCAQVVSAVHAVLVEYPGLTVALERRLTADDIAEYVTRAGCVIHLAGVAQNV